jgi:ethanolamine utilization cobalamin adenosyltransferase
VKCDQDARSKPSEIELVTASALVAASVPKLQFSQVQGS